VRYNKAMLARFKDFVQRNERPIASLALLFGFVFDSLTLRRVDLLIENVIFLIYIVLVASCILLLNLAETGKFNGRVAARIHPWLTITMQFCLGNLFSGYTVFYFRSSSIGASWPFLLFLVGLMIANEALKKQYERLIFQTGTFFIALFSYAIFILPVMIGILNTWIFLLSGLLSLIVISLFIWLVRHYAKERVTQSMAGLITTVLGIYAVITIFYFSNILPPIPLALKNIGVYHSLVKKNGTFVVTGENLSWFEEFFNRPVIHIRKGDSLYVFSAVFSPTKLNTSIVHDWQYFDPKTGKWIIKSKIPFPINGGRDGGYRGYSYKTALQEGKWRVNVETLRGQVIGQTSFTLEYVDTLPALETTVQ
jgi:hypothetical protein